MDEEQESAERGITWVYKWLLVAIIPYSIIWAAALIYTSYSSANYSETPTLLPSVVFLVLLLGLRKPYRFSRAHTIQALFIALVVTLLNISGQSALLTGFLWIGGAIIGWQQVRKGECWLSQLRSEDLFLPRPWIAQAQGNHDDLVKHHLENFRYGSPTTKKYAVSQLERLGEVEEF